METESGNLCSDPGDSRKSLHLSGLGGRSSMLRWGYGSASLGAALNVGPGLEKAENEEDNRENPWMLRKPVFKL